MLESGIKIVLEETRLEDYVKDADIVITGEGRLDGQTVMGKAPIGVANIAKKYGKPVLASVLAKKPGNAIGDNALRDLCLRTGCDTYLCMAMPVMWNVTDYDSPTARSVMRSAIHNIAYTVANSQELRRMDYDSMMDERTLREIYLTGFEIAVKEGKPFDVEKHHKMAAKASELKNESSILPLKKGTKVAVIGELAQKARYQGADFNVNTNSFEVEGGSYNILIGAAK